MFDLNSYEFKIQHSKKDDRDYEFAVTRGTLRPNVDLREWDSLIEDQGQLGSCASNAITSCYELQVKRLYPDQFKNLSRLFLYYNARLIENSIDYDYGITIKDGVRSGHHYGICIEDLWPYDIEKFNVRPTEECYQDAIHRIITEYRRIRTVEGILESINNNIPVVIGTAIYSSFTYVSDLNPVVPIPGYYDKYIGNHAMAAVGYDLKRSMFLVKNSFGNKWGMNGYCLIPFEYAEREFFENWNFDINNPFDETILLTEK